MCSLFRVVLFSLVVFGLLCPAWGQVVPGRMGNRAMQQAMQQAMQPFTAEGTVEQVAPGCVRMLSGVDQQCMVFIHPKTVIHVVGTAEAGFLKPGLFVRFKAEVDKRSKGKIREPVEELAIFTPFQDDEAALGFWPEGAAAAGEGPGEGFGADVAGQTAGGKQPTAQVCIIAGQVTSARRGKLTVNTGKGVFKIEMAKEPKISVDFGQYVYAKKGDKISVTKGRTYAGEMGRALADEIKIELAEPLGAAKKKPVRSRTPTTKRAAGNTPQGKTKEEPPASEARQDQ